MSVKVQVSNASQLALMAKLVNDPKIANRYNRAYYILSNNINLSQYTWMPIGSGSLRGDSVSSDSNFFGTFDGNNGFIKNVIIKKAVINFTSEEAGWQAENGMGSGISVGALAGACNTFYENHKEKIEDCIVEADIVVHPTVEQTTSLLITESVRGDGAILVNQSGVRFGDELRTRDVVSASVIEQEGSYAYLVFDQQLRDVLSAVEKYIDNSIVVQADTIEELAKKIDMDAATLSRTVTKWNEAVASKNDKEFGRDTGMEHNISVGPYYAIKIAPGVHHTMGGLEINTNAEVINTDGAAIDGLFAAGEVTGGIHGGNRIGGTAVTDIVVFGRVAGTSAAEYVSK